MGYAVAVALDLLLTTIVSVHIFSPITNLKTIGVPFLFLLPFMTICGPLLGVVGTFLGSPSCLKLQSSFNGTSVLVNYPLTIIAMLIFGSDPFYIALIILLIFNKIAISYFGAKVRQHWLNPGFSKNHEKIQDRFRSLIQARSEAKAGIKPGMSAQERAMNLVNSALPSPIGEGKGSSKGL